MQRPTDAVVIGAGFYGLRIALHLRESLGFNSVVVFEKEDAAMDRASYVNQARVHGGYHYPRSILTAYRSQVNFPVFVREFGDAVVDDFEHYYAIARTLSKVNARQFELFCARVGAFLEPAESEVAELFNPLAVEAVYHVTEPAFDSRVLRRVLLDRIEVAGGIEVRYGDRVESIEQAGETDIDVHAQSGTRRAHAVVSATYSELNPLHRRSGIPTVPLQHEITEMALVELPDELRKTAVTVMDGPFFSVMPFPSRGLHTLSHVRYTPHHRWRDDELPRELDPHEVLASLPAVSRYQAMRADLLRFLPGFVGMEQKDSIWEVKTVLPKSASDDSRPILFRPDHGLRNYTCIMGGKLDNIYDVLQELTILYG
ncbi:FAD-binding oxidoreductase [Protaetiibacter sp. SSC-01]|uniref:NAD(P)/FAD-dependent oxidoreductase n=1 Tax=Protaetiibacter sp. SSC-01 TaxID=2759943 RepID=UPI001656D3B7|nr:FAD-dependent oxidoreductase [Protaetiibacter sp. SSC-01]QNO37052.1 FAD-binding oxidoreductase [Protaetiibacter sp. SSC-01]